MVIIPLITREHPDGHIDAGTPDIPERHGRGRI